MARPEASCISTSSILKLLLPSQTKNMELRRLNQPTDFAERTHFVLMWMAGMSSRAIARETGKSVTTVCRWIRRWRQNGNVNTRPRCGRPRTSERRKAVQSVQTSPQQPVVEPQTDGLCHLSCCRPGSENYYYPLSEAHYCNVMALLPQTPVSNGYCIV